MKASLVENAALKYGSDLIKIIPLSDGLIHKTYKIVYKESPSILLQCINKMIFGKPEKI